MKELKGTKEEDKTPPAWFTSYMEKVRNPREMIRTTKCQRQNLPHAFFCPGVLTHDNLRQTIRQTVQFCIFHTQKIQPRRFLIPV